MTTPIQAELNLLHKEFISMGNMVYDALHAITRSLLNNDIELVPAVIDNDKIIDGRENTIDQHCIHLWATKAPVAQDLRMVLSIIRSTNELERLGDHAKSIGRSLLITHAINALPLSTEIKAACSEVPNLLDQALQAYQRDDSALARHTRHQCKSGKTLFQNYNPSLVSLLSQDSIEPILVIEMHSICTHLQRIYAIIGNICKNTIYQLDGEIVRHGGREHPLTEA